MTGPPRPPRCSARHAPPQVDADARRTWSSACSVGHVQQNEDFDIARVNKARYRGFAKKAHATRSGVFHRRAQSPDTHSSLFRSPKKSSKRHQGTKTAVPPAAFGDLVSGPDAPRVSPTTCRRAPCQVRRSARSARDSGRGAFCTAERVDSRAVHSAPGIDHCRCRTLNATL